MPRGRVRALPTQVGSTDAPSYAVEAIEFLPSLLRSTRPAEDVPALVVSLCADVGFLVEEIGELTMQGAVHAMYPSDGGRPSRPNVALADALEGRRAQLAALVEPSLRVLEVAAALALRAVRDTGAPDAAAPLSQDLDTQLNGQWIDRTVRDQAKDVAIGIVTALSWWKRHDDSGELDPDLVAAPFIVDLLVPADLLHHRLREMSR